MMLWTDKGNVGAQISRDLKDRGHQLDRVGSDRSRRSSRLDREAHAGAAGGLVAGGGDVVVDGVDPDGAGEIALGADGFGNGVLFEIGGQLGPRDRGPAGDGGPLIDGGGHGIGDERGIDPLQGHLRLERGVGVLLVGGDSRLLVVAHRLAHVQDAGGGDSEEDDGDNQLDRRKGRAQARHRGEG